MADRPDDRVTEAWRAHRAHVVNVAFRLLRDIGAAEDAAQEAFTRLARQPAGSVRDERAWLVAVTGRLCLDVIRSARWRLDDAVAPDRLDHPAREPDPVAGPDRGVGADPADRITLDDRVGEALRLVLRRLSPAERVVLVLHDVFRVPHEEIGDIIGRPPSTCRQLATRARRRVAASTEVADVTEPGGDPDRRVRDAFAAACALGDLDALVAVLHPDVSGDGRFGPGVAVPPPLRGADAVARRTLAYLGPGTTLVDHPAVPGALLAFAGGQLLAVVEVTVTGGRIAHLHADGHPDTIAAACAVLV